MNKIEYIEFYVENLSQSMMFYQNSLQFVPVAYSNQKEASSVLLQHGEIRIMLTSSTQSDHPVSRHIDIHGDGIKEIAFQSDDVDENFNSAINSGSKPVLYPTHYVKSSKRIRKATVTAYGDTHYTFIERKEGGDYFLPNFEWDSDDIDSSIDTCLNSIDHIAICVEKGSLQGWVDHHKKAYNLRQSFEEYVSTNNSSMKSVVLESSNAEVKFVILESGDGKFESQVDSFINHYGGAGVQHVAFSCNEIIKTVEKWRHSGVKFLDIPDSYYENSKSKINLSEREFNLSKKLSILIDCNESGCLYQIFTKPVVSRPTIFFEIVQRIGALNFAGGNINALFGAIEQEQFKHAADNSR